MTAARKAKLDRAREIAKSVPGLLPFRRWLLEALAYPSTRSILNVVKTFPLFVPYSAGGYKDIAPLTIQAINQFVPFLANLAVDLHGPCKATSIEAFPQTAEDLQAAMALKVLFDKHRSDKANSHNYHLLYGPILKNREQMTAVFEIGLGTNNNDVVSNMGANGKPGASLRGFKDFLPNALIFGADIDTRVLFAEDRIKTFFVDQTNPSTFDRIDSELPRELDLFIDDGLHSPNANIASLQFGLKKIKVGGWVVVEDIPVGAVPVWFVVSALLPDKYQSYVLSGDGGYLFAVQRKA